MAYVHTNGKTPEGYRTARSVKNLFLVCGSQVLTTKRSDIRHLLISATTVVPHSDKSPKHYTYHFVHEAVYGLPSDEIAVDIHRFMHSVTYMAS
jgi:hypothetical protein